VVICLEQCADLHMAQLTPLPLTVSFFTIIQIGFTFLVPAHLGSPRQRAVCVCVRVCVWGATYLRCGGIDNKFLKSVNIWQSYKQEGGCFVHFV